MPPTALAMVLAAAGLHTAWNLLLKEAPRKDAFTCWALLCGALLFLPLLFAAGPVAAEIWPYAIASALVEVVYYVALTRAYDLGEFSLVYPLARGAAPVLLAIGAVVVLGERPRGAGLAGIAALVAGLILVAVSRARGSGRAGAAIAGALSVAACISLYSLIDAAAVRRTSPSAYTVLVLGLTALFLIPVVALRRGGSALLAEWRLSRGSIVAVGAMTLLAYLLVLGAYARAPVSYAGAVRESSIVMAAIAGRIRLGERLGPARLAGAALAFAGILLIALGR